TCAITRVVNPRCGQENICSIETNSSNCVIPVMTSGITSGAFTIPVNTRRPGNLLNLTRVMAARVPRMTAPVDEATPTSSDSNAARNSWRLWISSLYQRVENPPHTLTRGEALNEYAISTNMGM